MNGAGVNAPRRMFSLAHDGGTPEIDIERIGHRPALTFMAP
jgi:hypothetical protein